MSKPSFQSASPYKDDVLALPVADLDAASDWYCEHFGMTEVERVTTPNPAVILERDGVRIGFAINGGDPAQEGAAIRVSDINGIRRELESNGIDVASIRVDERDGEKFNVFFVVAPDGLCYYFNEPIVD
ncbi:glyoxylase I family protein [Rhodopirellula baltica SH28]|uniref:Glyoxylase I family protein n=1 Tax=Rhodopirellula baltica SH28 TaxID=993517 RepID=K5CIM2_RHOBT|nr:VOC family protein [Rhodopirellula baltica]EKK03900.1 glyoxylase I family protein [Rhodopirellula baltica SH28]